MKEFKGTGGKWFISPYDVILTCVISTEKNALGHETICYMNSKSNYHDECNARLIAAAPDLLKVLQDLMEGVRNLPPQIIIEGTLEKQYKQAEQAINKALGL